MAKVRTQKDNTLRDRARALRHDDTDAEARLWNALRARRLGGWRWRRQVPKGPFILDFLCVEAALVVELDGGQHADQAAYDARRTAYLEGFGLRVIRFWNPEVLSNLDGVCLTIDPQVLWRRAPVYGFWLRRERQAARPAPPLSLPLRSRFAWGRGAWIGIGWSGRA